MTVFSVCSLRRKVIWYLQLIPDIFKRLYQHRLFCLLPKQADDAVAHLIVRTCRASNPVSNSITGPHWSAMNFTSMSTYPFFKELRNLYMYSGCFLQLLSHKFWISVFMVAYLGWLWTAENQLFHRDLTGRMGSSAKFDCRIGLLRFYVTVLWGKIKSYLILYDITRFTRCHLKNDNLHGFCVIRVIAKTIFPTDDEKTAEHFG